MLYSGSHDRSSYRRVTGPETKKKDFAFQHTTRKFCFFSSNFPFSLSFLSLFEWFHLFRMERARTRSTEFKGSASFVGSVNPQRCVKFVPDFLSVAFVRRRAKLPLDIQNESLGSAYSSELTIACSCCKLCSLLFGFPAFRCGKHTSRVLLGSTKSARFSSHCDSFLVLWLKEGTEAQTLATTAKQLGN